MNETSTPPQSAGGKVAPCDTIPTTPQAAMLYALRWIPGTFPATQALALLFLIERTAGWGKEADQASKSQAVEGVYGRNGWVRFGAGLQETAWKQATKQLASLGVIVRTRRGGDATSYAIAWPKLVEVVCWSAQSKTAAIIDSRNFPQAAVQNAVEKNQGGRVATPEGGVLRPSGGAYCDPTVRQVQLEISVKSGQPTEGRPGQDLTAPEFQLTPPPQAPPQEPAQDRPRTAPGQFPAPSPLVAELRRALGHATGQEIAPGETLTRQILATASRLGVPGWALPQWIEDAAARMATKGGRIYSPGFFVNSAGNGDLAKWAAANESYIDRLRQRAEACANCGGDLVEVEGLGPVCLAEACAGGIAAAVGSLAAGKRLA